MNDIQLIIVGASGFGRQIAQYIEESGARVEGFLDDDLSARSPDGYRLLGTTKDYRSADSTEVVIAVSEPAARKAIADRLRERNTVLHRFIHPTAYVAKDAQVGSGSVICPFSHIGSRANVGTNVLMNTYSFAGHDTIIGSHSALMGFACINGGSRLGLGVYAGPHVSVNPSREIGSWSKIAAGSIVYQDMPEGILASGNPARALPLVNLQPQDEELRLK